MSDNLLNALAVADLPEMEDDDETEEKKWEPTEVADTLDILDAIGTEDFKNVYLCFKNNIEAMTLDKQLVFCSDILKKIETVYGYVPPTTPHINNKEDVKSIYEFLEFLEFKNVNFLAILFNKILPDNLRTNIKEFIEDNWDKIYSRILKVPPTYNSFITDFLKLNTKINLLNFLTKALSMNKTEVLVTIKLKS
jgi:hypothetical protein